jgi:hypothetical protein
VIVADELILLTRGDRASAESLFQAFAERTGLSAEPIEGGVRFALAGEDHAIRITQTLNSIDPHWSEHVELGQPGGAVAAEGGDRNV